MKSELNKIINGLLTSNAEAAIKWLKLFDQDSKNWSEKEIKQVINRLTPAANKDHPYALLALACFYYFAIGMEKDLDKAVQLLRKSAEQNNVFAMLSLVDVYLDPNSKNYHSRSDAMTLLHNAVDIAQKKISTHPEFAPALAFAAYTLGELYETKQSPDFAQAEIYYQIACDQGRGEAANKLGLLYERGQVGRINGKPDYATAEYFYKLGIERQFGEAAYNLAILYADTQTYRTKKVYNCDKAQAACFKAIELNYVKGWDFLAYLTLHKYEVEKNNSLLSKVIYYYKQYILAKDDFWHRAHACNVFLRFIKESKEKFQIDFEPIEKKWDDFFRKNINFNATDDHGNTMLQAAILSKDDMLPLIFYLISCEGFPLNHLNQNDLSALEIAGMQGREPLAFLLINQGAEIRTSHFPAVPKAASLAWKAGFKEAAQAIQEYFVNKNKPQSVMHNQFLEAAKHTYISSRRF